MYRNIIKVNKYVNPQNISIPVGLNISRYKSTGESRSDNVWDDSNFTLLSEEKLKTQVKDFPGRPLYLDAQATTPLVCIYFHETTCTLYCF